MTTTRDIIERAHRKIGVVADDEEMTAQQAKNGLDELNAMMHGWNVFGVDVSHEDLVLTDDFSLSAQFIEGTVYQLASRLSHNFEVPGVDSDRFFRALQAQYMGIERASFDTALTRMPSDRPRRRGFN